MAACFAFSSPARANPIGPSVATGVGPGGIAGLGTSALTITTNGNAIVNWQGFSIGINEITKILQPSAVSAILNRVAASGGQSLIDGALQSNGRVFLINPNGIVFGASSRIDVAGLVASSLSMSDGDFLAGKLRFTETPGAGGVVNNGVIQTASGGNVYLIAPDVQNAGVINAPNGDIVLAAGKSAELVSDSSPYVSVKVVADAEQALNVGSLVASSGRVGMFGALVRNSGVAEASAAVAGPGGQISFIATKDLTLDAGSRTAANGTSGGTVLLQAQGGTNLISGTVEAKGSAGNGGTVQALGVRVGVVGNGIIDASGDTGGGTVLVGGDTHGANPDVQNAQQALIGPDGVIRADAGTAGNGGRVIVWSDDFTQFYGSISARGGSQSGNGGFVETSGHTLNALGSVNVGAANGQGGTWLLDPQDIDIVSGSAPLSFDPCYGGISPCYGTIYFSSGSIPGTSSVSVGAIDAALAAYGSVEAQAQRDINFQTDLILTTAGGSVTARAGNNINLGAHNIVLNGSNLVASASDGSGGTNTGVGAITSTAGFGNIATGGGSVTANGVNISVGNIDTTGGAGSGSPFVTVSAQGTVSTGSITTGSSSGYGGSFVSLSASTGSVTTGSIMTGSSSGSGSTSVNVFSNTGSITTGSITTGSASTGSTYVSLFAAGAGGSITVNGPITTGSSTGVFGDSEVFLDTGGGGVTVNGSITTGNSSFSEVEIFVPGAGSVMVAGNISTGTAVSDGGEGAVSGVFLNSFGGSVTVLGGIATGNATMNGSGGAFSDVSIYGGGGGVSVQGPITTGNASTTSTSPFSGSSSTVFLQGNSVQVGSAIRTGNADGGEGSFSTVQAFAMAGGIGVNGSITTGSAHFNPAAIPCCGLVQTGQSAVGLLAYGGGVTTGAISTGSASSVNPALIFYGGPPTFTSIALPSAQITILADGAISTGALTTSDPANTGEIVSLMSNTGGIASGAINAGQIGLQAMGDISVGALTARSTNPAIAGGSVSAVSSAGGIVVSGPIDTRGADGVAGMPNGTAGGSVMLSSPTSIMVGPPVTPGVDTTVINTSGGAGAAGGMGGNAGSITVDPTSITMNGVILALGGAGSGAAGGNGGNLQMLTTGGLGTITFINGGWDLSGGAGSPPGVDGIVTAQGTLIFITVLNDALSNPAVAQAVGSSIGATLAAANSDSSDSGGGDSGKDKKKGFGSCKPS